MGKIKDIIILSSILFISFGLFIFAAYKFPTHHQIEKALNRQYRD